MKKQKKQKNTRKKAKKPVKAVAVKQSRKRTKTVKKVVVKQSRKRAKAVKTVAVRRSRQKKASFAVTRGNVSESKIRILSLILAIIFFETAIIIPKYFLHVGEKKAPEPVAVVQYPRNNELEKQIRTMVKGYPIENMTPYIASKDKEVAAYLISIAKKESNWGKRKPVLNGQDCYNYWGFRLKAEKMGSGGHTCFDSPQEAVDTVADRIDQLVNEENIDTPREMVVWKCGYDCTGPAAAGAKKWIKDVDYYYNALIN